jgi:hypothetical protein
MMGRLDLSPRITVLSLTFGAFLLVLAGAVPSRGRMKVVLFYLLMLSFPLVALAAIEAVAIAFHLADRFAPLEDMSTLVNRSGWLVASQENANIDAGLGFIWRISVDNTVRPVRC